MTSSSSNKSEVGSPIFGLKNMSEEIDLYQLRDFIFDQPGRCSLFLHIRNTGALVERVIKASPSIRISADTETIQRMQTYPNVVDVWRE